LITNKKNLIFCLKAATTGTIPFEFLQWQLLIIQSVDDGITWPTPVEITKDVKRADWTWYATGPCQENTWTDFKSDLALVEPICQASMHRYSFSREGKSRLLFTNPANTDKRCNMTLRLSSDDGAQVGLIQWCCIRGRLPIQRWSGCLTVISVASIKQDMKDLMKDILS